MRWLDEPAQRSSSNDRIIVNTSPKTDFWRVTHYGFIRDNGHFYFDRQRTKQPTRKNCVSPSIGENSMFDGGYFQEVFFARIL
jgi:regulation of enolase protein 1 (concanavalin A-like superfamily)